MGAGNMTGIYRMYKNDILMRTGRGHVDLEWIDVQRELCNMIIETDDVIKIRCILED